MSGVDLKGYVRKDQKETFAALAAAGLVDMKNPDGSKILAFVARKPDKPGLVTDQVRKQE